MCKFNYQKHIFLIVLILSPLFLKSEWLKLEPPKYLLPFTAIASSNNFQVGFNNGAYFSFDNGKTWEWNWINVSYRTR